MELRACIRALEYIRANAKALGISRAIVLTDSQYVNEYHTFAPFWRKNSWRNRHGRPVENKELWREFLSLRSRTPVRVDIAWNLGKSTPVLKMVDKRHRTTERGAATLFPARNQELVIKVYTHTLVGKADCKVSFTVFLEGENKFAQKHVAYVTGAERGEIHRHHCYRVRFNDSPNYPIFKIIEVLENCPALAKAATVLP